MYVRKFEAESMNEALKRIKQELGPDAIILKTITNKGLKGAFKKNKIEITAAISEKNYTKKAKVDHILDDQQKSKFYDNNSSYISNMIDDYEGHDSVTSSRLEVKNAGYGDLGLNRPVKKIGSKTNSEDKTKSGLDEFLSGYHSSKEMSVEKESLKSNSNSIVEDTEQENTDLMNKSSLIDESMLVSQREKIDELERKIFELTKYFERIDQSEPIGIFQLRTTLCSLGISENYIQEISKKAIFELSKDELRDTDLVFEFALREMLAKIHTTLPLFSHVDEVEDPVVTVLISEVSCGQTSTLYKLGALKKESVLVRPKGAISFTEDIFSLQVEEAETIPDYVSSTRRAIGCGRSVFLDYKCVSKKADETKSFIDGLRRSFAKVEVLICLSSIHSETYNRKVVERYSSISDGLIVTQLDLCLNYGSLFNIGEEYEQLPFKFFGTGEVIPEDLEAATSERVLAGMFQLK